MIFIFMCLVFGACVEAPPIQRCETIAGAEHNYDDINGFRGKITNFKYKFLGEKRILGNFSQEHIPFRRKAGDYLPLDEGWEVHEAYVLEIIPKDPDYCYPKKILYIDKNTFESVWSMSWDKKGNLLERACRFYRSSKASRRAGGLVVWDRDLQQYTE